MSDTSGAQQERVIRLTDKILSVLAGFDMAEAQTALTLAVITMMCADDRGNAANRLRQADGFAQQVRDFIQREDVVAWIEASIVPTTRSRQ
jgi:hypothetical protein